MKKHKTFKPGSPEHRSIIDAIADEAARSACGEPGAPAKYQACASTPPLSQYASAMKAELPPGSEITAFERNARPDGSVEWQLEWTEPVE